MSHQVAPWKQAIPGAMLVLGADHPRYQVFLVQGVTSLQDVYN